MLVGGYALGFSSSSSPPPPPPLPSLPPPSSFSSPCPPPACLLQAGGTGVATAPEGCAPPPVRQAGRMPLSWGTGEHVAGLKFTVARETPHSESPPPGSPRVPFRREPVELWAALSLSELFSPPGTEGDNLGESHAQVT